MSDLLLMDKINALPHPLFVMLHRDEWWPVHDIDVETGLVRIDVIGLLQVEHFGGVLSLRDADGTEYATDDFYNEDEPT